MQRKIITTSDGSKTIFLPEWNEQYHSKHGALLEANYVFIKQGLYHYLEVFLLFIIGYQNETNARHRTSRIQVIVS